MEKTTTLFFECFYDNLEEIVKDWLDATPSALTIDEVLRPWFECWTQSNKLFSLHWRIRLICFFDNNVKFIINFNQLKTKYNKLSLLFANLLQFKLFSSNIMEDNELCFLKFKYNYMCNIEKVASRVLCLLMKYISPLPEFVAVFESLKQEYSTKSTFSYNILHKDFY